MNEMPKWGAVQPFNPPPGDALTAEHSEVSAWVEEADANSGRNYNIQVKLNRTESGRKILSAKGSKSARHLGAALIQIHHWRKLLVDRIETGVEKIAHEFWIAIVHRNEALEQLIEALLRRKLQLRKQDLIALFALTDEKYHQLPVTVRFDHTGKAVKNFVDENEVDAELMSAIKRYAAAMTPFVDSRKELAVLSEVCSDAQGATAPSSAAGNSKRLPHPNPAPAGRPGVLIALKKYLGMLPNEPVREMVVLEADGYRVAADSPLMRGQEIISAMSNAANRALERAVNEIRTSEAILAVDPDPSEIEPDMQKEAMFAGAEREFNYRLSSAEDYDGANRENPFRFTGRRIFDRLITNDFDYSREECFDLLLVGTMQRMIFCDFPDDLPGRLLSQIERDATEVPLTEGERYVLSLFRLKQVDGARLGVVNDELSRLSSLIADGAEFFLAPDEYWSDAVNDELSEKSPGEKSKWVALLRHAITATSSRPSSKWSKSAKECIETLGEQAVVESLERWLPLLSKGQSAKFSHRYSRSDIHDQNADALRGLLWIAAMLSRRDELIRLIASVALHCYKKLPAVGPRAPKVGNAAVYALSQIGTVEAVGQLAMLKIRVKSIPAQKEIEKAFLALAEQLGLPRDQVEEMGVPTYGLEEVGVLRESLGDYRAELTVNGSTAALAWFDANGKPLKSVPARIKAEHQEELKELQQSLKDIQGMLPAQRDRIDSMFLAQRSWGIETWRERYLDHPLVGTISRRLIWCVDGTAAFFVDGKPIGIDGKPIEHGKTAEITLWHPVGRSIDQITAWRQFLEEREIVQPFKQAHREVYLLTDAELNTRTYSNRFAAHVIRQHQFHALCGTRGWRNRLRLMVDAAVPPASKLLPNWGLRAEYWIEGIGDDYGTDTNDAGSFLRLATDQVRFYRTGAAENLGHASGGGFENTAAGPGNDNINEPLPLDQIPPLVFSEIMRDVDLFVGVASVGNDPTWQDGGPEGRYREYWQNYSFGELSGTATTRKEVLDRLIPKLKIASRCTLSERFLVVRGDKRTYKIHLGSGNILMEPNDQYLCIVPDARARADKGDLFLPFEGDNVLSIILSKALLLAEDAKIKDQSIVRQIDAR